MSFVVTLTVTSGKVASNLSGFVVRVDLSELSVGWWADTTSDLGNVRVKQAGSVIPFDVVTYDRTAKTGELFFRAPSLLAASDNVFTVETVNGATALAATDTNGRDAVWADFEAVVLGGQLINRKGGAAVTATGTATAQSDGTWDLPGGGSGYLSLGSLSRFTQWTTAASMTTDRTPGDQHYMSYGVLGTSNTTVATQVATAGTHRLWASTGGFTASGGAVTIGTRYRTHYTHDGSTTRKMYRNGSQVVTDTAAARPGGTGACGIYVGTGVQGSSNSLDGRVGYAYLRSGLLSADWIAAEYVSWETPSSFYALDSIPSGLMDVALPALSSDMSGWAEVTGQLGATLPALSVGSTGALAPLGPMEATLPALGSLMAGGLAGGPVFGDLAGALPVLSAAASGTSEEFDGGVGFAEELPDDDLPPADIPDPSRILRTVAFSVPPVELVDGRPTQAWKDQAAKFEGTWGAYRLLIGGVDWTLHRGYPFQMGTRQHADPFGYAAMDLVLPSVTPWETADWIDGGTGDLVGLSDWAPVVLQVVDEAGVGTVVWRGFIGSVSPETDGLHLTCNGEARGRLEWKHKTPRPFAFRKDCGLIAYDLARRPGLRITPDLGLTTGVVLDERSRSMGTLLDALEEVFALSQQSDGRVMTCLPTGPHGNTYAMQWRDTTTVHATVFYGAQGINPRLQSNLMDRPTTLFGVGRDADGGVWANIKAPGLFQADPPPFPGVLSPGDDSPEVNTLKTRLEGVGYLDRQDAHDEVGFGDATTDAVKDLQEDFGHAQTGIVDEATWNAAYDIGVVGYSLAQAHSEPLAQLTSTKRFLTTASGAIAGPNPDHVPERPEVEEMTDYDQMTKRQARKRARARRFQLAQVKQWAGELRLESDLFLGDYHHGDPDPVIVSRFTPLAGLNVMLRGWDGDILLHVAGDDKDQAGASLSVDTAGRPLLEVRQMIERNKEGRQNPAKTFRRQNRGVAMGAPAEWWSEIGGEITVDQPIQGDRWNVIDPVVAGDMGTLAQVALELADAVEFACALFAIPVNDAWCNANLPDPFDVVGKLRNLRVTDAGSGYENPPAVSFSGGGGSGASAVTHIKGGKVVSIEWTSRGSGYTSAPSVSLSGGGGSGASADVGIGDTGSKAWQSEEVRDMAKRRRILLEGWGDVDQPCGYGDGVKSEGATLDGTFVDAAGLPYRTYASDDVNNGKRCLLYWAIWPKSDTVVKKGRSLYPNPEVGM